MKKWIFTIILASIVAILAACGGNNDGNGSSNVDETKKLHFGATAGPYSDMLTKAIIPGLEEKGYEVKLTEFSDYVQPNNALNDGSIDANLFQHVIYLENFAEENDMDLKDLIVVPTAPLGLFSNKYESVEDIEDGATVTIPNDPVNAARTLITFEDLGLIEIDGDVEPLKASEKDITKNDKNLEFLPIEAGQLPRSVDDADIAAVPGNFAIAANMDLMDAIALEDMPDQFRNIVAVKAEDANKQFALDIIDVIESDEFEAVIDEEFEGFGKPAWMLDK
ncbi:MAG TPA: hypothetical protein H9895_01885 [Candidatus Pseudogracilibacillus intestinigallinarum]|uniref:Lipoprotein n=1 Tax=Candidatus Pseudogracilibacillus intestinigallinarum TaxID=2838742 RepID=A0A9D1TJY6_9BACI|nr:hypothetical protein [Candidatus Pseudogracilibacillus intestinigallinarum]